MPDQVDVIIFGSISYAVSCFYKGEDPNAPYYFVREKRYSSEQILSHFYPKMAALDTDLEIEPKKF